MNRPALIVVLAFLAVVACSLPKSGVQPPRGAEVGVAPSLAEADAFRSVEIWVDRDRYGFDDWMTVNVMNVVDHEVALFGLCNLQVQGRWNGQWWRVWHVDCSRERHATTWVAPGDTARFEMGTRAWAKGAFESHDAFVLRHLGAVSEPFRLDPDLH